MGRYSCYVVIRGRKPGVYATWEECNAQVYKVKEAKFWGCHSEEEAYRALSKADEQRETSNIPGVEAYVPVHRKSTEVPENLKKPKVEETSVTTVAVPHTPATPPKYALHYDLEKNLRLMLLFLLIAIAIKVLVML